MSSATEIIHLGKAEDAFSQGGNRLCFIRPDDPGRCIKVLRTDRSPAIKKQKAGFPKNLRSLSAFNDNLQEADEYRHILSSIGNHAYELIPQFHGFVETNLGQGLCSELIRDDDGKISITLKQYIWINSSTPELKPVLEKFVKRWESLGMPSRKLLLHNIVLQMRNGQPSRLVVIDGFGWPHFIPMAYWLKTFAKYKARKNAEEIYNTIDYLLKKRESQTDYGYHGWLEDEKRE